MDRIRKLGLAACAALALAMLTPAGAGAAEATDKTTETLKTQEPIEIKGDPPGELTFYAHNKAGHESKGIFKKWNFTEINIPNQSYEGASLKLAVDINSMSEENQKRLEHLKTEDFFNVKLFPTAYVTITDVKPAEGKTDEYTAKATVEIRKTKSEYSVTFTLLSKEPLTVEGDVVLSRAKIDVGKPYKAEDERSIYDDVKVHFKTELKQ